MKAIIFTLVTGMVFFSACSSNKSIQQPEYREIQNVHLIKPGVLQTTTGVNLVYYNPNSFSIQLKNARGDVYIDNAYFGHFEMDETVQVRKRSEFNLPVVFKLDNIGALKNQRDLYKKKEAMVRIEGTANVKKAGITQQVPINYEKMQSIDQLRAILSR